MLAGRPVSVIVRAAAPFGGKDCFGCHLLQAIEMYQASSSLYLSLMRDCLRRHATTPTQCLVLFSQLVSQAKSRPITGTACVCMCICVCVVCSSIAAELSVYIDLARVMTERLIMSAILLCDFLSCSNTLLLFAARPFTSYTARPDLFIFLCGSA